MWRFLVLGLLLSGCGPSTVQDAEQAQDVSWLAEHAKGGDAEALLALCGLAKQGVSGAPEAFATARATLDPSRALETISCVVDLGLAGNATFAATTRELLKAPAIPVRTSTLNALQAAATDATKKAAVVAYVPDIQARLRDEEQAVWKRAVLVLHAVGPEGRKALSLSLTVPERTRRRELVRDIVDLPELAPELGPPAVAWIAEGEEEVFDHLLRIIVKSGTTIETAKPVILQMLASGDEAKIESARHFARALADEGRCDAEVVRAVVSSTVSVTCEEPCLVQARSVAYKCRRVADAVLREIAAAPLPPPPPAAPRPDGPGEVMDRTGELTAPPPDPSEVIKRPREIARATLGL